MLTKNLSSSELTKQRETKTIYLNYLAQKQAIALGQQQRLQIQTGSAADSAASQMILLAEGAQFTTVSEELLSTTVPNIVTNVAGVQYTGTLNINVSWTPPSYNGGTYITSYIINVYNTTGSVTSITGISADLTSTTITLTSAGTYTASVIAVNADGNSVESAQSSSFIVQGIPSVPTNVVGAPLIFASQTNASATVTWTAPSAGGSPITGYTVNLYWSGTLVTGLTPTIVGTTATFSANLTFGLSYTAKVLATNAFGSSALSAESAAFQMYVVPTAPTSVTASNPTNNSLKVSWTAGSNGGFPVGTSLLYTVTSSPGAITTTTSSSSSSVNVIVSGLTPGTLYTFTVTENNGVATSAASTPSLPFATSICLAKGTLVLLFNGLSKVIESIVYSDLLSVWDFDEGKFVGANPLWIKKAQATDSYNLLKFSDGTILKTINQHRIFNKELGKFTYPMTEDTPLGTTTFNSKANEITLVSKEIINEEVEFYNIITNRHMNLFANTILTSCRYNNIYPIENMKFVKDARSIVPLESYNVSETYYNGLRLGEQLIPIENTNKYVANLEAIQV